MVDGDFSIWWINNFLALSHLWHRLCKSTTRNYMIPKWMQIPFLILLHSVCVYIYICMYMYLNLLLFLVYFLLSSTHFFKFSTKVRARLVHVFKNWKLLFENICGNTCGWKSALKYVKCCLKTENCCLKTQTKHPLTWFDNNLHPQVVADEFTISKRDYYVYKDSNRTHK